MRIERSVMIRCFLLLVAIVSLVAVGWLGAPPAVAQEQPAQEAAASEAPAEEAPAEEDSAPAIPAGMDGMDMSLQEFELRLLPLTLDELTALADTWQGIVQEQTEAVVEATLAARAEGDAVTEESTNTVVAATEVRNEGFERLSAVVDNMEKKGGDEAAIATYRAYRTAISFDEKQQADWGTLAHMAGNWLISWDGGLGIAKNVVVLLVAFLVMMMVARVVRRYARRFFGQIPDLSQLLQAFLTMVVYWLTIAVGLMVVLSALGVDITPLFAVVGGASFIIAFAMQDTLGNLAAGLMIMFNRPFDEGDYITAGGTSGTVQSVSVVSTTVTTPDNQVIVIPNSKVWGDVITNTTASEIRRVDMVFGIGYDDSIEEAQKVLEEVVNAHPAVLKDPAPVIRVGALADSSVNFIVRPWSKREDYWGLLWDLNRQVKEAFDARGISIPFPQTDMHIKVEKGMVLPAAVAADNAADRGRSDAATDFESGDDGATDPDSDQS